MNTFLGLEDHLNPYNYKTHFMPYLENKEGLDILFLRYEDFEQNPEAAVQKILQHLGLDTVTLTTKDVNHVIQGKKENMLPSWKAVSNSIFTKDFYSFFDIELRNKIEKELKVDWNLVMSGTVWDSGIWDQYLRKERKRSAWSSLG